MKLFTAERFNDITLGSNDVQCQHEPVTDAEEQFVKYQCGQRKQMKRDVFLRK